MGKLMIPMVIYRAIDMVIRMLKLAAMIHNAVLNDLLVIRLCRFGSDRREDDVISYGVTINNSSLISSSFFPAHHSQPGVYRYIIYFLYS